MPTIFEHISNTAGAVSLDGSISGQLADLYEIGQKLIQINEKVKGEINILGGNLDELFLDKLDIENVFADLLDKLSAEIPLDVNELKLELSHSLEQLTQTAKNDVVQIFLPLLKTYRCLSGLLDLLSVQEQALPNQILNPSRSTAARAALPPFVSGLAESLEKYNNLLDSFIPAITADQIATFLANIENGKIRRMVPSAYLPLLDEFSQIFSTLSRWKTFSSAEIGTEMIATLQSVALFLNRRVEGVLTPIEQNLSLFEPVDIHAFGTSLNQLRQAWSNLAQAVEARNTSQIEANLNAAETAVTTFQEFITSFRTHYFEGQSDQLLQKLQGCSATLNTEMLFILNTLNPPPVEDALAELLTQIDTPEIITQTEQFSVFLQDIFGRVNDLVGALNLAQINEAIVDGSQLIQNALTNLDDSLTETTTQVSFILEQALSPVKQFDSEMVIRSFETTLDSIKTSVVQQTEDFFNTIKQSLSELFQTLNAAIQEFNPLQLKQALSEFTTQLGSVLSSPDIVAKLEQIKAGVEDGATQLEKISFKPLSNLVIDQIEEISQVIQKLTTNSANTATKIAISAAITALPGEQLILDQKNGMLLKMDDLATTGPIALLRTSAEQPARLMVAIQQYSPLSLVGKQLSKPYQEVLKQLERAKPSQLVQPLDSELEKLKSRLIESLKVAPHLRGVNQSFDLLLSQFKNLSPAKLLAPLQQGLSDVIAQILQAVPIGEISTLINAVAGKIQELAAFPAAILQTLEKMMAFLQAIQLIPSSLESWFSDIFQKIEAIPSTVDLMNGLQQIRQATDRLKAESLQNRLLSGVDRLSRRITQIDLDTLSTQLIRTYRDFPLSVLDTFPADLRAKLQQFHTDHNPMKNGTNELIGRIRQMVNNLDAASTNIEQFFGDWDLRFQTPNSPLVSYFFPDFDLAKAKEQVRTTIENEIQKPLTTLVQKTNPFLQYISTLSNEYQTFLQQFNETLPLVIEAPNALSELSTALDQLIGSISNFNLDFVISVLEDTHTELVQNLEILHPQEFAQRLDQSTLEIMGTINLSTLLPQESFQNLDHQVEIFIQQLQALDPEKLITELVQPEFERQIEPYLKIFDLTDLLDRLLAIIDKLKADLDAELNLVIKAYQKMKTSAPNAALSVDIGADLGF